MEKIYIAYYQRPADPLGLIYWAQRLDLAGGDLTEIIDAFANSEEAQALYGDITEDTIGTVIDAIYQAAFNRAPDEEGKNYYINGFKEGKFTPGTIALDILNGAKNDDAIILQNKLESALNFTKAIDPELDGKNLLATYEGNDDAQAGRDFLKDVGVTVDTVKDSSDAVKFIQEKIADPGDAIEQQTSGQTFTLTQGAETVEGTDGDDTIDGVASSLASARTLDAGDKIDGGAGNDTLKVDLQSNFAGFTGEGFLKNVEVVELTNSGTIAREFSAKGVEGVQSYVLNGEVSLKDLASTAAAITLNGQQKGVTVGFTTEAVSGSADALTLNLNGVGTADDAATTADETVRVQLTAAGIEELNLGVAGTNVVTVTAADAKSVVATGEGSLDAGFSGSTNVKTIDASAVAGNVTLDLDALTAATSVKTGAGDDTISANTDNLAVNATIDGGAGADRLVLETGTTTTTQYSMSGVETLALEGSADLTFSAKNVTGLETVEVASGYTADTILANLGSADLTFALKEDSSGSISADNAGAATVNVTPVKDAKDYDGPDNDTDLTLTNATSVALNVAKFAEYTGTVNALKATSLEAKIDGKINNNTTINLTAATSAVFNATDKDADSSVILNAGNLVDLNITTAGDFEVNSGSGDLTKLEALTVATAGAFSIGDLAAINTINLTGTGTAALVPWAMLAWNTASPSMPAVWQTLTTPMP